MTRAIYWLIDSAIICALCLVAVTSGGMHAHAWGVTLTHLLCVGVGVALSWAWRRIRHDGFRLPPATRRQLERASRASRLKVDTRTDTRPYIPLPKDGFTDDEVTR